MPHGGRGRGRKKAVVPLFLAVFSQLDTCPRLPPALDRFLMSFTSTISIIHSTRFCRTNHGLYLPVAPLLDTNVAPHYPWLVLSDKRLLFSNSSRRFQNFTKEIFLASVLETFISKCVSSHVNLCTRSPWCPSGPLPTRAEQVEPVATALHLQIPVKD